MSTFSKVPLPSNDIATWGVVLDSKLLAAGWTRTSDTGQQNWSGPPAVGAVSNGAYNLYQFNDSLQSTTPFILKIIYGNNGLTLQAGNATNGAGTFTGSQTTNTYFMQTNFPATSLLMNCFFSGANNRFTCCLWDGPVQSASLFFSIERTKDTTGADTNEGILFMGCGPNGNNGSKTWCQAVIAGDDVYQENTVWPAAVNQVTATMANANYLGYAFPIAFNIRPYNYGLNALVYQATDFVEYYTYPITVYGQSHTYLALSSRGQSPTNPAVQSHILMRYE